MSIKSKYNLKALKEWQLSFIRNLIWRDWRILFLLITSLVLNIAIWIWWYLKINIIGPIYNPFANEFLGTFNLSLPLLGLILIVINFILAIYSWSREKLASFILVSVGIFLQVLILILFYYYLVL